MRRAEARRFLYSFCILNYSFLNYSFGIKIYKIQLSIKSEKLVSETEQALV